MAGATTSDSTVLTELKIYAKGTKAFFSDDELAWVQATLTEKTVDEAAKKVHMTFERKAASSESTSGDNDTQEYRFEATFDDLATKKKVLPPLCNPPLLEGIDDLTSLSHLNEPAVLHNLQVRYGMHNIYTYSGIVLVALNPFDRVALYSQDTLEAYAGRMRGELEPHLFAISEDAFQGMVRDKKNQTIIVSGESGAGKTMSAKYIMRYFAAAHDDSAPAAKDDSGMSHVEEQILATNPVLEAFGNAKTTRNDNSSRFGKFLEIRFNERHAIEAAFIRTYLLERSRLVYQPPTERNYHVFYQLLAAAPDADRERLGLTGRSWESFHYTSQGGNGIIAGVDDAVEFANTAAALDVIGVDRQRQAHIHSLLAALLHVGNIEIGGASERSGATIGESDDACARVVELLQIDGALFRKWLTKKQIVTRSEKIVSAIGRAQALVVRDSVAKFVYAHLFDWIVRTLNEALTGGNGGTPPASFIGVLDIYGFEHFEHNSFEQFCINYANEKLQQNFNRHVFKLEQEEYQREQLQNWTFVDFQDNQPCIDLIEGRLGVLALLDEESRLQQGSDATFTEKLIKQFAATPRPAPKTPAEFFRRPRFGADSFTIRHYAHDVSYEAVGFIEKNKDTVPDEIQNVLRASGDAFLADVLSAASTESASSGQPSSSGAAAGGSRLSVRAPRKPTLGTVFKHSLASLMETIEVTESHYIRCIKPNDAKAAWRFDAPMVLSQLRACGVLETIRISCAGYPSRLPIPEFIHRYRVLLSPSAARALLGKNNLQGSSSASAASTPDEYRRLATDILQAVFPEPDRFQVGLTKVFFRSGMLAVIEKHRVERLNAAATAIQSLARMHQARTRFQRQRKAALALQTAARGVLARRELRRLRDTRAAISVQALVRAYLARRYLSETRTALTRLQALVRGSQARHRFKTLRNQSAAIAIQRRVRGFLARKRYNRTVFLVVRMQAYRRAHNARVQLGKFREEKRSAAHFKEVTYKLEGKLMELTRQLDESQSRAAQLAEKLRLADKEARELRATQTATIEKDTAELRDRVDVLQRAKADADAQCAGLREELARAREDLEAARQQATADKDAMDKQRTELEQRLADLQRELDESRAQLADVRAQHQQQMLIQQQGNGYHGGLASASGATPAEKASSIKRSETHIAGGSRWRAAGGYAATGYDMADSSPMAAGITAALNAGAVSSAPPPSAPAAVTTMAGAISAQQQQQQQQQQQLHQRRPHSSDYARTTSASAVASSGTTSVANKRSTIGGDEGRTLAKMLGALGGFGGSGGASNMSPTGNGNARQFHQSLGGSTILEEEETGPVFELRSEDDVREMLEHDDLLIAEVLNELIGDLQVPMPNVDAEYSPPDLLFPAHLIGLCVIKMFQYNLARRIDRLLMSTIARIQKKTAAFESDYTSAFWLSNVFELLSIIKTSMTEHQSSAHEYAESERAMNDGMQYLESLLSDIYFGWIKDLQKRFVKLIIPGVVESEALPGFTASDSGFFNRLMGTGPRESSVKIENVLSFFNHIWRSMEFYYVDPAIMRQIMSELLCNIGVTAFNNIIMRRNFCSWKRGMQVQYNLTRIEEWCKTHSVADATRNLDRLLQLVKLLQLQKSTEQDIDIMFEVCDLLNPAQIKKLLSIYAVSDYENPIIGLVMNEVTRRAAPTEKTDKILLDTNDLNDQVLYLTARKVPAIETYIPPEFRMPRVRALVDSQTDMSYDDMDDMGIPEEEEDDELLEDYDEYAPYTRQQQMSVDMQRGV
ncbi:Myosin type-2 heavy chain 1 [Coemansia sp. RSA 1813]|nr:Myosin type-2 heavy chain 1 [Coemansia sp. RSA 1646]KAJ1767764.1 Myosin type-2 heavy chain 1 [Coemansia sp. RSA 1843]KAJ2087072.1 Myosin type-2 heavy chain 1 [Coemansia sp. RSA 986]KAJ2212794.1 Myosin type-2 heavy chain 1 [Coemansia sp. RSA 487]KAJ2564640.1 Myosin type-2 heavy chain 1 [Coemansia sp. RSA 1813]